MSLLADYAITPDVFDLTSYSNEDACRAYIELIREPLLTEGLVRDLRKGEWRRLFNDDRRPWHQRGKELVKKLFTQQRLIEFEPALSNRPAEDQDWCAEALTTHQLLPFTGGIISTEAVKNAYPDEPLVARIDRLGSAQWWASRSPSVRPYRTTEDYKEHLDLVLRHSNSLLFIDPYLDPTKRQYPRFHELLVHAGNRTPSPLIEIHRVWYEGSGPGQRDVRESLVPNFRERLESPLRSAGLQIEVFVWDDFHDRYLISNLMGISLPNGFDTTAKPNDRTTWNRLGRDDRDDVQREFDKASKRHTLHRQFTIP